MRKIICWWSGGITSAVACKLAIEKYGKENCQVIMIDTHNEHSDTYRFALDCEKWYGLQIEGISAIPDKYKSIQDVWRTHLSLNVANGAICSYKLKRVAREKWEKTAEFDHQVFGFEFETTEFKRALALKLNHSQTNPIFPLLEMAMDKKECVNYVIDAGIRIPEAYALGFMNNNCLKTGCVSAGIGYWKKMQLEYPEKFDAMAAMEHELTDEKGSPVTCLKDQSNAAKAKKKEIKLSDLVFLKKHPDYDNKCLDDMKGRKIEPLVDCNGLCGIDDLIKG